MESSRAHGFTLIEIIVSITLLLVLSGLFMASYNGFNSSQTVKQAASTLIRNLQAVRTKAASGNKPTGCDTLTGYIVKFPNSGSYTSRAICQSGEVGDAETYSLPAGVTFPSTPATFTFYALDRGASAGQTITLTGFGTTAKVSVFTSGVVSDFIP
jgi:prepilin-type N-terminal cleavage/methylation domain-containing protein